MVQVLNTSLQFNTMDRNELITAITDWYVDCVPMDVLIACYRESTIEALDLYSDKELESEYNVTVGQDV